MTKRYMLFAGMDYNSYGGMGDFVSFIDKFDVDAAMNKMKSLQNSGDFIYCDWAHIYDVEEGVEMSVPSETLYQLRTSWCYGN